MDANYARRIIQCNLLTEEDSDYVTSIHPKILQMSDDKFPTSAPTFFRLSASSILHILVLIVSVVLTAVTLCTSFWILILFPAVFFAIWLIQTKILYSSREKLKKDFSKLDHFLQANEKFQILLKKCIRFIQEMEIAAMGYTLVSGKTPIHRLEKSKQKIVRECMQLRYQCLRFSIDSILHYRTATLDLLHSCTLSQDAEFSLSICQIPIGELGPCFVEEVTYNELTKVTDSFCLDILRDTSQFLIQQRSEFLKTLLLKILNNPNEELSNFSCLPLETMKTLTEICENASIQLRELYELHSNVQINVSKLRDTLAPVSKSPLHVAIHSVQVHLRAALLIAIKCEKFLEEHGSVDDLKDDLLRQLKVHIDAGNECFAETERYFNHNSNISESNILKEDVATPNESINGTFLQVDSSLLNVHDDFTEDQIFEGTPDDIKEAENEFDDDTDSMDSRKKRIEETIYVMKELKSVLHVKTSAEEREVRKSKLFPNYAAKVIQTTEKNDSKSVENDLLSVLSADAKFEHGSNVYLKSGDGIKHNSEGKLKSGNLPDFTHKILTMPRRAPPPGRTKHRPSRLHYDKDTTEDAMPENLYNITTDHGPVALGFGFPSFIASQAARVALAAKTPTDDTTEPCFGLVGSETTFGD